MKDKKKYSYGFIILVCSVIITMIFLISFSFYKYYEKKPVINYNEIEGGSVSLTYGDDSNIFTLNNYIPMDDLTGMKLDSDDLIFDFTIKTVVGNASNISYDILLSKEENSNIRDEDIKIYLEKETDGKYVSTVSPVSFVNNDEYLTNSVMKLYTSNRNITGNDNYRLRLWVSDKAQSNQNKNYAVKILLRGTAK